MTEIRVEGREVVMISRRAGTVTIDPRVYFLWPCEAKHFYQLSKQRKAMVSPDISCAGERATGTSARSHPHNDDPGNAPEAA